MALEVKDLRNRAISIARHPRTRKLAIWLVSVIVAIGVLLGLVAPPLIRGKIASALSDKLHRQVSIEQIKINPYTMTASIRGFLMKERQSQSAAVSFDELFVNLEMASLFRLAPVVKELRLAKPYVNLVRNNERQYNFQDLIDEFTSGPPGPTPRFALNNIEIIDGKIDFDDQPEKTKHSITSLKIGIPFISSLPSYADIKIKPEFAAVLNGSPIHLAGVTTTPFKESLESSLGVEIDKLEIAKYLEYSPVQLNFKMPSGRLDGKIQIAFRTEKKRPAVLSLTGNLGVAQLEMQQSSGEPLIKLPGFEVSIGAIEIFANKTAIKSVKLKGLDLHLKRAKDGSLNVANLVVTPAKPDTVEPKKESDPINYSIDEIALESATLHFEDQQPKRPFKTRLDNFAFKMTDLTSEAGKKANVEISFESEGKEKFVHTGTLQLTPLLAEGKLEIEGLKPGALSPYYEDALAAEVKEGSLDLSTRYSFEDKSGEKTIKLAGLNATLRKVRLDLAGQPEPIWRIASLAAKDVDIDVAKKTIVIGGLEGKDGGGYLQRDAGGVFNLTRIAKAKSQAVPPPTPPAKTNNAPWRIDAKQISLERLKIDLDDRSAATPAKTSLSEISLRADNFSTAKNQRGKATLRAKINNKGLLRLAGTATLDPINAKFSVEAQDVEIVPFQAYLADKVNFLLTSGAVGTKGELTYEAGGDGGAKINYQGSARVADFGSVEKIGAQDLLNWKSLALDAVQFSATPFQLNIGEITLGEFYSRLILGADGKTNLQKLTVAPEEDKELTTPAKAADKAPLPSTTEATAEPKAISIGKINLHGGNINFSDFFIKPNYSANLTGVQGAIAELKPEAPGDLDLRARLDDAAPVEIKGQINPLSKDLFLDIIADAREIELNPFTPYSGKYVGYGIEKGKLSFNVKYKLENRRLSAENKIILNQLTFGEKIESPDATKLPVLLAVALLKDRNGVIDVDLPISGSLDDPQFSVGGIVLRIVINLITKAVTAPFSLLASAFGGGVSGDELSYIEFAAGRADLDQADKAKIATLAKALNNRPALNLEITGRLDPLTDLDGLKRVSIERKVKAQKLKELARRGAAPRSVEDVQVDKSEYAQYLKAAYGEESFPKPRNIIGLAQDLPVPEMEKLMMQHAKVSDDEVRQLAGQRAQTVLKALLATGQVGAERLFVVSSKPLTNEERAKLKGRPNRVDFSMK